MKPASDLGLLLLHALPLDREMWSEQMDLLPDATYAPNLYQFGGSIKNWAAQSLAATSSERLVVVGCSVGGSCALEVAKLAPERVCSLVLVGTKAAHDPDPELFRESVSLLKTKGVEAVWDIYWRPLFQFPHDEKYISKAKSIAISQSVSDLENGLTAFHTRPSSEESLAGFDLPVHVVTGEDDVFPGLQYSDVMASKAKYGKLHIIRESGHYVPLVQSEQFNEILKRVIDTVRQ